MPERQHPVRKIKRREASASSACQEPNQNCFSPLMSDGNFSIARSARQEQGRNAVLGVLAVTASWYSQHKRVEGREKEQGSPRETWKAAGHQAEMEMDSLGREVVPLPEAQRPHRGSWSRDGAGMAPTLLAQSRHLGLNFTLREEPREPVRCATAGRERGLPCKPRCARSAPCLAAPGVLWLRGSLGAETAGCVLTSSPLMPPRGPVTIYWVSI